MRHSLASSTPVRKRLTYLGLAIIVIIIGFIIFIANLPFGIIPDDFFAYWASGQLLLRGENPYSPINSMVLSEELGFEKIGILLSYFYPPWTLPIFIPFGALPFDLSRRLWFVIGVFLILICAIWIWKIYGGPSQKIWIPLIIVLSLSPVLFALMEGQITPLTLLGLSGFLHFERQKRWCLAGAFLALVTFKIHMLYLFWIALIFWVIKYKRWGVILGLVAILISMTLVTSFVDNNVINEFIRMNKEDLPKYCNNPTLSSVLCIINNQWNFWYLLIAPFIGFVWFLYYWRKNKGCWIWKDQLPLLIFLCLITAPYIWMHDGLLYLLPIIEVATIYLLIGFKRKTFGILILYILANTLSFLLIFDYRINQIIFIWMPFLFLLMYLYLINKQKISPALSLN